MVGPTIHVKTISILSIHAAQVEPIHSIPNKTLENCPLFDGKQGRRRGSVGVRMCVFYLCECNGPHEPRA